MFYSLVVKNRRSTILHDGLVIPPLNASLLSTRGGSMLNNDQEQHTQRVRAPGSSTHKSTELRSLKLGMCTALGPPGKYQT